MSYTAFSLHQVHTVWPLCQKDTCREEQTEKGGTENISNRTLEKSQVKHWYSQWSNVYSSAWTYWQGCYSSTECQLVLYSWHRVEREKYYSHCVKSRHNPDGYITIIVDGMDQQKTCIPHFISQSKVTSYKIITVGMKLWWSLTPISLRDVCVGIGAKQLEWPFVAR